VSKFVTRAELPPGIFYPIVDINDRALAKSDDLCLTAGEALVSNFCSDTESYCREINVRGIGDPQFDE
jgi:hypothetical protein